MYRVLQAEAWGILAQKLSHVLDWSFCNHVYAYKSPGREERSHVPFTASSVPFGKCLYQADRVLEVPD